MIIIKRRINSRTHSIRIYIKNITNYSKQFPGRTQKPNELVDTQFLNPF